MSFAATWMDLEIIISSELSGREKQISYGITICVVKKRDTNELIYKTERDAQT